MIDFIDNFLPHIEYEHAINYCLTAPYYYGEVDDKLSPRPAGMTSEIAKESQIFKIFDTEINKKVKEVKDLSIYRMYVNCFAPEERAFYHSDGKTGITCLFYVNPDYDVNVGGETQFIVGNNGINILPIPNRLAFFDANILHKATSFVDKHRFTIAIKYA
jgi:hypothetical protein